MLDALPNFSGALDGDQFRAIAAHLLHLAQPSIESEAVGLQLHDVSGAAQKPFGSTRAADASLIRCSPTAERNTPASTISS